MFLSWRGEVETTLRSMKRRSWGKPWGVRGAEGRGTPGERGGLVMGVLDGEGGVEDLPRRDLMG